MIHTTLRSTCALVAASVAWYATLSPAAIVGGNVTGGSSGGVFQLLVPPPLNVGPNAFQSPNLLGFNELQDWRVETPTPIRPGLVLPTGAVVSSHYVAFDPNTGSTLEGIIEFDAPIVALIQTPMGLENTSPLFGAPQTNYVVGPAIGPDENDLAMIDPNDRRRLLVNFGARGPGDNLRVLTGVIPEPATLLLGCLAVGGFALTGFRNF